jgi:hypothetical protein
MPSLRRSIFLIVLISFLLLIPCFWHCHIEAGDLGSHTYNAWLAQLVGQGRAPGVYVVWQWQNVLFDLLLFYLAKLFGFAAAEKIAVSLCVLIFFWGVFALITVATHRPPGFLTPLIAMLAYGYTFHMGFFNYYISVGLSCFGLALIWRGSAKQRIDSLLILPLILLAHPLGALWFLGAAAYIFLWQRFAEWRIALPPLALVCIFLVRWIVTRQAGIDVDWPDLPFYVFNGADQLAIFGKRYWSVAVAAVALGLLMVGLDLRQQERASLWWSDRRMFLELYAVSFCATALLPENLQTSPASGWIGLLVSRLSLMTAILALCLLGSLRPQKWHLAASAGCALVFFAFVRQDTGFVDRLERNAESLTHPLPFGTRLLKSVYAPPDWRTPFIYHSVERACIGHCFAYSNYEASTKKFRIRARADSPVVVSDSGEGEAMESGEYDVEHADLPAKQIYQCDPSDLTKLCIRDLAPDEKNGRLGYHPPH